MSESDIPADERLLDLDGKSIEDLRAMLDEFSTEEMEVSYRRRVLHGKIDILRAEIVRRMKEQVEAGGDVISGTDIDKLVDILSNEYRGLLDAGETGDDD
jgi:hypothetical protein